MDQGTNTPLSQEAGLSTAMTRLKPFGGSADDVDPSSSSIENTLDQQEQARQGCGVTSEKLLEIGRERRAEIKRKAEEKRRDGLRRIAEMNSKKGIEPLDLFPKEIWCEILAKINPSDRLNMRGLHDVFRNLLASDLIGDTLLPLVLSHDLPLIDQLSYEDIESLQEVSKNVRDGANKWVEDAILEPMRNPVDFDDPRDFGKLEFQLTGNMEDLHEIVASTTIEDLRAYRSFKVDYSLEYFEDLIVDEDEEEEVWQDAVEPFKIFNNKIKLLLEEVGERILRFEFSCWKLDEVLENLQVSFNQFYLILRDWLILMPNLKWLDLQIDYCGRRMSSLFTVYSEMNHVDSDVLLNQPMPVLASLERVDFMERLAHYNVFPICDAVLSSNPHVKYHFHNTEYHLEHHWTSPPVLALALETANIANSWYDKVDLPFLQKISNCNWNLKKLTLWMNARKGSINEIFQFLEKFPTLENLTLHVDDAEVGEQISFPRFPNVTVLELEVGPEIKFLGSFHSFFSLDFLLASCAQLKSFTWRNLIHFKKAQKIRRKLEMGGSSDFQGGFADLSCSKIWDAFPRLESVDVAFLAKPEHKVDGRTLSRRKYFNRKLVSETEEWLEKSEPQ